MVWGRNGVGAVLLAALLCWGAAAAAVEFARSRLVVVTAEGRRQSFEVELAVSEEQLAQGLMNRREMAINAGMLFDFGHERPVSMWMKNTLIPLDMLFIAADGRVVMIAERTEPHSLTPIGPKRPVRAVLELKGGTARLLGLKTGDRVEHPLFTSR